MGIIPLFGISAFGGGGFGAPQPSQILSINSGFIIQEMDENGNTVFMQHILANDYGIPMDITVSSYQSADFQKIDQVCEPQKLFTNPSNKQTEDYLIGKFG